MTKRFTNTDNGFIVDYESKQKVLNLYDVVELLNELHEENRSLKFQLDECRNHKLFSRRELEKENEQLKQQLSDINGQLVMLDNCDNWDYDRMKHTVREIAEIIGYNGTINPKR